MLPVPTLGAPFRRNSGVVLFNRLIYGDQPVGDQIVPFQGELFLDFAYFGVVAGFGLFGLVLARVQSAFVAAADAFAAFAWQYAATWLGFLVIGSLAVVSQIAIYFSWPLLVFAWLRKRPSAAAS
jgi:hypothetical protein